VVVAAGLELDPDLDALEERRDGVEDEPVAAGLDLGKVVDAAVVVCRPFGDEPVAVEQLDPDAAGGHAALGVEDVRRDHAGIFYRRPDDRERVVRRPRREGSRHRLSKGSPYQNQTKAPPITAVTGAVVGSPKRKSVIR
jgi:hypothetical protein